MHISRSQGTPDEPDVGLAYTLVAQGVPDIAQVRPTLREALARGVKIKMTLGLRKPKGKVGGGEANGKTKVGPCWRSFIQGELSRGPHNTQPCKERKIKEHNTGMTETRAARVEQNTRHKAEPSTLYQVYRCIN